MGLLCIFNGTGNAACIGKLGWMGTSIAGVSPASRDRGEGAKLKSGGQRFSPKSEGFFWPKSQILTFFSPKNTNFLLPKKYRGGQEKNRGGKNENQGGIAPPLAMHLHCYL